MEAVLSQAPTNSTPTPSSTSSRGSNKNRGGYRRGRGKSHISNDSSQKQSSDPPAQPSSHPGNPKPNQRRKPKPKPNNPSQPPENPNTPQEPIQAQTNTSGVANRKKKQNTRITEQTAHVSQQLKRSKYECMVCFDKLGKRAFIWMCGTCYHLFHIGCIKKWYSSSLEGFSWKCPACRTEINEKPKSRCFCGKASKPNFDPYLVPHSCGDLCGRKREETGCPHACNLVCHPGPCPPCSAMGPQKNCFCKRTVYRLRCGEFDSGKSCGQPCPLTLNCGKHQCSGNCHSECPPCNVQMERICYCGKSSEILLCGTGEIDSVAKGSHQGFFACNQICGARLSCGNHFCSRVCHSGPCGACETGTHLSVCPCGATKLSTLQSTPRKSCLDPIPVCEKTCSKILHCGIHSCKESCHNGPCPDCEEQIETCCRCSSSSQIVPCIQLHPPKHSGKEPEEPKCKVLCESKRTCGRHRCNTVCCPMFVLGQEAHPCPLTCNRPLSCKNHKCQSRCHSGRCPRCPIAEFDRVSCNCGKTYLLPPVLCGTPKPICQELCSRDHDCSHPVTHSCHYESECPKCVSLVTRKCGCGADLITTQCHNKSPCCGRICSKALRCGIHNCQRICHGDSCQPDEQLDGQSCENLCGAPLENCSHQCSMKCHPGQSCPSVVCEASVTITCPCGNLKTEGKCNRPGNGIPLDPTSYSYVRLSCNEVCQLRARRKQLALAFGRAEDGSDVIPSFGQFLTEAASSCLPFIQRVEKCFVTLIQDPEAQVHRFPPMNSYYRRIIHELGQFYRLDSQSYDAEPHRNVVVAKTSASHIVNVPLFKIFAQSPVPKQPGTGEGFVKTKPGALLFSGLNSSIRTEHLHAVLRAYKGEYALKWIDDETAVAIFNDESVMKTAAYTTSSNLSLNITPLDETTHYFDLTSVKQKSKSSAPSMWDSVEPKVPVVSAEASLPSESLSNQIPNAQSDPEPPSEPIAIKPTSTEPAEDWTELE